MLYDEEMKNKRMGCYVGTITDIDDNFDVKMDENVGHGAERDFNYIKYYELNTKVASHRIEKGKLLRQMKKILK